MADTVSIEAPVEMTPSSKNHRSVFFAGVLDAWEGRPRRHYIDTGYANAYESGWKAYRNGHAGVYTSCQPQEESDD